MHTTNISVVADDTFMKKVLNNETYQTYFDFDDGRKYYETLNAKDIFDMIVDGAWRNGEPGLIFYDRINDSPYQYSNQEILASNPCGEQPLPPNGVCNLGSLDISKFLNENKELNYELFELAIRLSIRFLDSVITVNKFPTEDIHNWAMNNRPVGLGIMGTADYFLEKKITYGSKDSFDELEKIMKFIKEIAENESETMGKELGIPEACKNLPVPRRNVTVVTIAPTGTISLLAGCNSGIEPFFSEITTRTDKTGTYEIVEDSTQDYFRCAVSSNGSKEVTWEEHVRMQASAQKYVDSAVSKTINFPNHTHKDTIGSAFVLAWELGCKGITVYRNGSRKQEVLSPKNLKKDKCPLCGEEVVKYDGCKKCVNCDWSLCEVG